MVVIVIIDQSVVTRRGEKNQKKCEKKGTGE